MEGKNYIFPHSMAVCGGVPLITRVRFASLGEIPSLELLQKLWVRQFLLSQITHLFSRFTHNPDFCGHIH